MTYDLLALQLDPNRLNGEGGGSEAGEERGSEAERTKEERKGAVSYTHLTLPTICSV